MESFRHAAGIAALTCCWFLSAPSTLLAEEDLRARFMKICKDDVDRNNPIWTAEQTEELCTCRTDMLMAEQSRDDVRLIVKAAEADELMSIPAELIDEDLRYVRICTEKVKKAP